MTTRHITTMTCLAIALAWGPVGIAHAASAKTAKSKVSKQPARTDYGESRQERDRRLLRECQGKPNTGACEGYAS